MTKSITIYKLIDPRDNRIFYIGATKLPLKTRLTQHIYQARVYDRNGCCLDRMRLISAIVDSVGSPLIESIKVVDYSDAHKYEVKYYMYYKKRGHNLLQSSDSFSYNRRYNTIKFGRRRVERFNFDLSPSVVHRAKITSSKEGLTLSEKINELLIEYNNKKYSKKSITMLSKLANKSK